jgi:hypothetical protein
MLYKCETQSRCQHAQNAPFGNSHQISTEYAKLSKGALHERREESTCGKLLGGQFNIRPGCVLRRSRLRRPRLATAHSPCSISLLVAGSSLRSADLRRGRSVLTKGFGIRSDSEAQKARPKPSSPFGTFRQKERSDSDRLPIGVSALALPYPSSYSQAPSRKIHAWHASSMTESNYALQDGLYDVKLSTQVPVQALSEMGGPGVFVQTSVRGICADPIRVRIRASAFGYGGRTQGSYDQALTPKIRLYER